MNNNMGGLNFQPPPQGFVPPGFVAPPQAFSRVLPPPTGLPPPPHQIIGNTFAATDQPPAHVLSHGRRADVGNVFRQSQNLNNNRAMGFSPRRAGISGIPNAPIAKKISVTGQHVINHPGFPSPQKLSPPPVVSAPQQQHMPPNNYKAAGYQAQQPAGDVYTQPQNSALSPAAKQPALSPAAKQPAPVVPQPALTTAAQQPTNPVKENQKIKLSKPQEKCQAAATKLDEKEVNLSEKHAAYIQAGRNKQITDTKLIQAQAERDVAAKGTDKKALKTADANLNKAENEVKNANKDFQKGRKEWIDAAKQHHQQAIDTLKLYEDQCKIALKETEKGRSTTPMEKRNHFVLAENIANEMQKMIAFNKTMPPVIAKKLFNEQKRVLTALMLVSGRFMNAGEQELAAAQLTLDKFKSVNQGPNFLTAADSKKKALLEYRVSQEQSNLAMAKFTFYNNAVALGKIEPPVDPGMMKSREVELDDALSKYNEARLQETAARTAYFKAKPINPETQQNKFYTEWREAEAAYTIAKEELLKTPTSDKNKYLLAQAKYMTAQLLVDFLKVSYERAKVSYEKPNDPSIKDLTEKTTKSFWAWKNAQNDQTNLAKKMAVTADANQQH